MNFLQNCKKAHRVVFHGSFSLTSKSISFQIESLIIFFRQKKLGTNFRLLSATPGERHRQVNFPIRAPIPQWEETPSGGEKSQNFI